MPDFIHQPVLIKEVEEMLVPKKGKTRLPARQVFVDGTIGLGGHAKMICEAGAKVIGLDRDEAALNLARKNLAKCDVILVHGNFADFDRNINQAKVDGILLDLGTSSMQFDDLSRGFSFGGDAKLDMRMDQQQKLTAREVVNDYSEDGLRRILSDFGEEKKAGRIARLIVERRGVHPINSTKELVEIIRVAKKPPAYSKRPLGRTKVQAKAWRGRHFATNVFRALRMEVNDEVGSLQRFLQKFSDFVKPSGRVVIISFNSIEDRLCKRAFKALKLRGRGVILTKKPIVPGEVEIAQNPRSRSAKLRAFEIG